MTLIIYKWFGVTIKGDILQGLRDGKTDYTVTWSDNDIHVADAARSNIQSCTPPSNHIYEEGYNKAVNYMRKGECGKAGDMIEAAAKPDAIPACVTGFKIAFTLVCKGAPELLKNALPTTYY